MAIRDRCVLCSSPSLSILRSYPSYPISLSTTPSDSDETAPLTFAACDACECVQILELVDPAILYAETHNNTAATPTWKAHHQQFADFVLAQTTAEAFLEVGGAEGTLAAHILSTRPQTQYTCLDLCAPTTPLKGIRHVQGNCETYSYTDTSAVIASHVFEHLYQPAEFVKRLAEARVDSVFLSIPNMRDWLNTDVLSFLHREHTFYCDRDYLEALFDAHGYHLAAYTPFRTHSEFFHFTFRGGGDERPKVNPGGLAQKFHAYFARREARLASVHVDGPTFLFPAGHYGQLVYTAIAEKGVEGVAQILGFLDNDPSKIGRRMYGTPHFVQSPEVLRDRAEPCTVLLVASVYAPEIRKQLQEICPTVRVLEL